MNGRLSTPLPNIPYAIAPKNKHFDQVNMQKDTERPQVSKATGKWKDFGKREWDPVGGNWKITPGHKKSPDIPEGSDKVPETTGSVPPQSTRINDRPAHKRSFGQINTDHDAAVSRPQKKRSLVDAAARENRENRENAVHGSPYEDGHERGRSRQPVTQNGRTMKREQSVQPGSVRQQSTARELSKDEARAFLYGSKAPNVGIEAATAALRQAREKKEISQRTGLAPTRRDSAYSDQNAKTQGTSRLRSSDRAISGRPATTREMTTGSDDTGEPRKIPFIEDEESDEAPALTKPAGKVKSVNETLFMSTKDPVASDVQQESSNSPNVRQRSVFLTQRSPIKVFRPTIKYSSPLGTKLDEPNEPRSTTDLQKASQALSEATSESQVLKAQSRTESLQKKQLGGYLHLQPKNQKPAAEGTSQQSRISSTSAVAKGEDEASWKMAKAATAMQRVMQKPIVNTSAIAAQAKAGAQAAAVPKLTATGFIFERPDQAEPKGVPSLSAAELDAITNTGPKSLRSVVDSRENIRELIADASKKTETKHRVRDRSRSRLPSRGPGGRLGPILGEDADGNLISEDSFILLNGDQGWVARTISEQLERRHGLRMTAGNVRKRYDALKGTENGILLRERNRGRRGTSQARSRSVLGGSERDDESFELGGNNTEDEDDGMAGSVSGQSSLQPSKKDPALRPTTGGKSPAGWKREYHDALTAHDSDAEGEDEEPALVTQPADRIFNVYTVYHRITATDDPNPEDTEPDMVDQTYYDLSQANTVAQKAALEGFFQKSGSVSWEVGDNGQCQWSHIHDDMITTTWVEREERLLVPTDPQPHESVNIIGRTVWAVKEEISQQQPSGDWSVLSTLDVGAIYSSLSPANEAAVNHLLEKHVLVNAPKMNRLEALDQWKAVQRAKAQQLREWWDERKEEFVEVRELGEGRVVKVSVVKRDFLGARN